MRKCNSKGSSIQILSFFIQILSFACSMWAEITGASLNPGRPVFFDDADHMDVQLGSFCLKFKR